MGPPLMAAQAALSIGQTAAGAVTHEVLKFRIQPGRYRKHAGKRTFEPNPFYPDGITISFNWLFIVTVGLATVAIAMGGLEAIFSGRRTTSKQQKALGDIGQALTREGSPMNEAWKAIAGG